MTIIDKYVARQLVFACVLAVVVLSGPVVLVTLFKNLPSEAVSTALFWPSLYGIACMVLYVSLPVAIAVAIVWTYSRLAADNILTVLHCAGVSIRGVRAPAFVVAAGGMVVGYAMSCFLAPHSAHNIHDMLFSLRHDIIPALLREGRFNEVNGGRQVIYFTRRLSDTELSDVFIKEVTDDEGVKAYRARSAAFVRNADDSWIVLHDGSMQVMDSSGTQVRSVAFDQIVRPATRSGAPKLRRSNVFYDEIPGLAFLRAAAPAFENPTSSGEWAQEAVKRFGFPPLAIIHTFLGLELLFLWGGLTERLRHPTAAVCTLVMGLHLVIAVSAENIGRINAGFAWMVVMMMIGELGAAVLLAMLRSGHLTHPVALREAPDLAVGAAGVPAPVPLAWPKHPSADAHARRAGMPRDRAADQAVAPHRFSPPLLVPASTEGVSRLR